MCLMLRIRCLGWTFFYDPSGIGTEEVLDIDMTIAQDVGIVSNPLIVDAMDGRL